MPAGSALDSFEAFARKKMDARGEARQDKAAEIKSQIAESQSQAQALEDEAKVDRDTWRKWHASKTQYEKDMAWCRVSSWTSRS